MIEKNWWWMKLVGVSLALGMICIGLWGLLK